MLVFIVFRDSNYHGDTIIREVLNVYDSLEKAQGAIQTEIIDLLKHTEYTVKLINEKNTALYVGEDITASEDTVCLYIETHNLY